MLPIYYINVARRTDRRDFMEQQFAKLGLAATRVEAMTLDRVPGELLERYCPPDAPRRLAPGDLAATLSHQLAWRDMVKDGASAGVVFEDDGLLSDRLPEFLGLLDAGLPAGIDLIKLETHGRRPIRISARQPLQLGSFSLSRLLGTHYGACGYIIPRRTAELALADPKRHAIAIDAYLFDRAGPLLHRRQVYQVIPALSIQLSEDPEHSQSPLATSDLLGARQAQPKEVTIPRWQRLLDNARYALRDARHFGNELPGLLGPRRSIPFAAD